MMKIFKIAPVSDNDSRERELQNAKKFADYANGAINPDRYLSRAIWHLANAQTKEPDVEYRQYIE